MNKKIFALLIILFFTQSCNKNTDLFKYEDLSLSSYNENDLFLIGYRAFVFVKTSEINTLGYLNSEELNMMYEKYYAEEYDYTSFLSDVLNFKKSIPVSYIKPSNLFRLDSVLVEYYESGGIELIQEKYTERRGDRFYLDKNLSDIVKRRTILYLFYINAYEYYRDDYSSNEWFEKKESLCFLLV
ncbi:hypothetical protein [Bergeyella sp. RCAD1439]|uniref:hypothetical protein n=1 Tax=Bergeyella anatis TaxID=3113737 RepID=UPI002E19F180|nr:hypothetical protein [Bergeyella sp. RCAD1439]